MRYQQLKVRDSIRLALFAMAMGTLLAVCFVFPDKVHAVLGRRATTLPWALETMLPLIIAGVIYYLVSTPAQNLRHLQWMQGSKTNKVDTSLIDPSDPDYRTPTWQYLLRRPHELS